MTSQNRETIYLDYAATTPVDPAVLQAMLPFFRQSFGNPSSVHSPGQEAKKAIDNARSQVARFLNCSPGEIIFTGSATEADNTAVFGAIKAAQKQGVAKPHIITTKIEHKAILEPCQVLEKQGLAEVDYLPVSKHGIIRVADVKNSLKQNTALVSVMYANNEIGAIQPIAEIGHLLKQLKTKNHKLATLFHTDAVQAVNYLDCNVEELGLDMLTLSGHKIYGPKGIGALYVKKGCDLEPLIYGGSQEHSKRGGTENVPGIVGLGAAIEKIKNIKKIKIIKKLRDNLIEGVLERIPGAQLNGSREKRLPNNANFSFEGAEGEAIVIALDEEGIASSTGSACSSRDLEPSHVLLALGLSKQQAHSSLRLTLGKWTTQQEINNVLEVLPRIVARLQRVSGR